MTQPPPPPNEPPASPPFGDETDEALSALLDGELAAFATERGLTEADAREMLVAWSGYATRREQLESVRAAVTVPPPALDDLSRRRLVRGAITSAGADAAAPLRARRTWVTWTAAAAAALIFLAGLAAVLTTLGTSSTDNSSSSRSAAAGRGPLKGDAGNLGNVTDPAALRALLDRAVAGGDAALRAEPSAPSSAAGGSANSTFDREATGATTRPPTPKECATALAGSKPVVFTGTGTYQGKPVIIVGIQDGGRTIAFVVAATSCADVLTSVSR